MTRVVPGLNRVSLGIVLAALCAGFAFAQPGAATPPPGAIPAVRGTLLSGQAVALPDVFAGRCGVLVLGFTQASRPAVTLWARRLASEYASSNRVLYFEMPMLGAVPRLLRTLVLHRLKDDVPERARSHFLPITGDDGPWKLAVHFTQADAAYVLVVDERGEVRLAIAGEATDASFARVRGEVASLVEP